MPSCSRPQTRPTITVDTKLARLTTAWSQTIHAVWTNSRALFRSHGQNRMTDIRDRDFSVVELKEDAAVGKSEFRGSRICKNSARIGHFRILANSATKLLHGRRRFRRCFRQSVEATR